MHRIPLDEALMALGPTFTKEVRDHLAPVKDQFFQTAESDPDHARDGLYRAPPYLADLDLRKVAIELAELAVNPGIDVNFACEPDGSTFLHSFVLVRDSEIATEGLTWLLAHGADPNC